jgi:hypothetical protein
MLNSRQIVVVRPQSRLWLTTAAGLALGLVTGKKCGGSS